jgi:hypothetical protein
MEISLLLNIPIQKLIFSFEINAVLNLNIVDSIKAKACAIILLYLSNTSWAAL